MAATTKQKATVTTLLGMAILPMATVTPTSAATTKQKVTVTAPSAKAARVLTKFLKVEKIR
ncbi:hypothetical protein M595_1349 [Lyngbya aestuarii BL J]|uniref:Uncharacterized protein n=1 Tax=Lyngbya aestuarii BL J TaxID=1348334 RepID=U7QLA1_9CYAN|nr:hypothetical protein M595_1349 [Lyngbya aestuarii BL J]